ncbi:MAG: ATP-binding cassette domain-containing protein [Lentisphaerae bacterium]|nr:ATP-binding cassette domain-containing protein [Lentisphaerota bacterium]
MAKENVIKVQDLTIGYGERVVLENLNFSISAGEIVCIMGGSGCGKSTLLKHLIGLYEPMKGDVFIRNRSIVTASEEEKKAIMRSFGVTYQGGALFGSMTVAENVELPLREYTDLPPDERMEVVRKKLELVGLADFGDFMPSELSGGMRKRAGLARALALDPDLLFFDEPSAGLDPLSSADLDRLILNLRDTIGATVVVITHELDSIFAIGDRGLMLDKARRTIVADGSPEYLLKNCDDPWVRDFLNRGGLSHNRCC